MNAPADRVRDNEVTDRWGHSRRNASEMASRNHRGSSAEVVVVAPCATAAAVEYFVAASPPAAGEYHDSDSLVSYDELVGDWFDIQDD